MEMINFKDGGIYAIMNKANNKIYIGSAKNINRRLVEHLHDLRKRIHKNSYLQNSWNKYGEYNFDFLILELCKEEDLLIKEDQWIEYYNTYNKNFGYNLVRKPYRPIMSEETREKLSKANSGCNNVRWGIRGCTRNKEQLDRHAKSCSKPIDQFNKQGEWIASYGSVKQAAEINNLHAANISRCLKGYGCTSGGYIWRYKTDTNDEKSMYVKFHRPIKPSGEIIRVNVTDNPFKKSEETKKKISQSLKGNIPWNKGKKMSLEYCQKISEFQKGRIPWNKGLPMTEEQKKKISLTKKKNKND